MRVEPFHLSLSSSNRLVRVFSAIVPALSLNMVCGQAKLFKRRAVVSPFVSDDGRWSKALPLQKVTHEIQGGRLVSSGLNQDKGAAFHNSAPDAPAALLPGQATVVAPNLSERQRSFDTSRKAVNPSAIHALAALGRSG